MYKFTKTQIEWLDRLEKDDLPQCVGSLFDGEGYCCLGVGCLVIGMEFKFNDFHGEYQVGEAGEAYTAPPSLQSRLRLHDENGQFLDENGEPYSPPEFANYLDDPMDVIGSLTSANDQGVPFKEIAAFCYANPEKVFKKKA